MVASIPQVFASLAALQGLTLLHASLVEHSDIALLATQVGLDFDDAYQAYFAERTKTPLISFDRHFDRLGERREPADFL